MIERILKSIWKNDLHAWVFVTGAIVLVIEVVAVRILAPYFGNTLFSVSSVLSVVLLALSVGYWVGGTLADKTPKRELFYGIILASGVLVLILELVRNVVLQTLSDHLSISTGPLLSSIVLFIGPAILLGMLSPLAIKLKFVENEQLGVGRVTGGMFFWSTLGSISGSLAAGFYLIPFFGVDTIMFSVGIILVLMGSTPLLMRKYFSAGFAALFLLTVSSLMFAVVVSRPGAAEGVLHQADGIYEQITIREGTYNDRPARFLVQDRNNSGASFIDSDELVYEYTKYFSVYEAFDTTLSRALVLGGGAYSIPTALLNEPSQPVVDVVDVEPSLLELSQKYFDVPVSERMINHIQDGRRFLKQSEHEYDVIYGDVYQSTLSIPSHFTTVEFFELVRDHLTDEGVFVMNAIGDTYQVKDSFFLSEMKTFQSVFPNSHFYAVRSPESQKSQNIIMVGAMGDERTEIDYESLKQHANPTLAQLQDHILDPDQFDLSQYTLITDNYAPVDFLMLQQLNRREWGRNTR